MSQVPAGWVDARLPDVSENLDSKRIPVNRTERAKRSGDVPYYGATGQVGWIDEAIFDEELVLVGEDGAPFLDPFKAKAYVIDGPSWVNNHAHVLRALADVTSNRFLKYLLDWIDYRPFVTGTTRLKLTKGALNRMPVSLPPLNEQRRIVAAIEEHLSRLDAADASLAAALRRLDGLRAATLTAAVDRHPTRELGSVTVAHRYGTSIKCLADGAGPPVLRIPNVRGGRIDLSDLKRATSPDVGESVVESGDLLFIRTNGSRDLIGRVAVVDGAAGMAFASYLIRVRPDQSALDPRWAVVALSSAPLRATIEARAASTAGQYNLNLKALKSLEIPLPPLEEQRRIVAEVEERLSRIDAMRTSISSAQRRSAALRAAILERAFRGELVPQDPSDEPAEALLARIRTRLANDARCDTRRSDASRRVS